MPFSSGSEIVDAVGKISITGNVIPHNWYNEIKFDNGKPNTVAILILAEIVYWYKPKEVKDEKTGLFLGYKKRFKADLLQRSYESFSEQFGFTKRQVRDAVKRLEDLGIITRDFRSITNNGLLINNVLFIKLDPKKLIEITYPKVLETVDNKGQRNTYDIKTSEGVTLERHRGDIETSEGVALERQTNTEITNKDYTEITTKNKKDNKAFSPSSKKGNKKSLLTTEEFEICKEVIEYLNEKANKKFKPQTGLTQQLIKKRLEEEYTIADFKRVVDVKVSEWLESEEWNRYLQPSTLFKDANFEKYLNQPIKKSKKRVNDPDDYGPEYFDNLEKQKQQSQSDAEAEFLGW